MFGLTVDGGPAAAACKLTIGQGQSSTVTSLVNGLVTAGLAGDSETITAVSTTIGMASLANGNVTYVAPASGAGTISYTVTDQLGDTATGSVAVTAAGPKVTAAAPAKVAHRNTVVVASVTPGLTGDTLTLTTTTAGKGMLSLLGGVLSYTAPAAGGMDSIGYTVTDQFGDAVAGTLSTQVDPGPGTAAGTLTIGHGAIRSLTALINGLVSPGLSGDVDTVTVVSATHGMASLVNGATSYTAPALGSDTLSYIVTDQLGDTATRSMATTVDAGPTLVAVTPSKVAYGTTVTACSRHHYQQYDQRARRSEQSRSRHQFPLYVSFFLPGPTLGIQPLDRQRQKRRRMSRDRPRLPRRPVKRPKRLR